MHEEVAHTADWALRVRAADFPSLLRQAALGMIEMMGVRPGPNDAGTRSLEARGADRESLLVAWLEEVLYRMEREPISFTDFGLQLLPPDRVRAEGRARVRLSQSKEIKAVTFHNLKVSSTPDGAVETTIVFDV